MDITAAAMSSLPRDTAHCREPGCRDMSKGLTEGTKEELEQVDFSIAKLANQIGTRDDEMDPVSIFMLIHANPC
jgi:hypothetical protein